MANPSSQVRHRRGKIAVAGLCVATMALSACGAKEGDTGFDSGSGAIKLDAFCSMPELPMALRETTIIVDTGLIAPAPPEEFREKNPELFKLVMGLGDPNQALESGATAPRERITILAGSAAKGTMSPVFTGCLPGASESEIASIQSKGGESITTKYFGSDLNSKISKQQGVYTRQLLLALMLLDKLAEPKGSDSGDKFATSNLVKLLRLDGAPRPDVNVVRRLFVFTDFSTDAIRDLKSVTDARKAGFKSAEDSGLHLGLTDIYVDLAAPPPEEIAQQYLRAYILGSQGELKRVGAWSPNGLTPSPSKIINYSGELTDGVTSGPMTLRIAATATGQMVNSWISYTASFGQKSTPVKGQFSCTTDRSCSLQSDPDGGLGQLWRLSSGNEPEAREDAPFGGLRFMSAKETGSGIEGRIFDPAISIGHPGGGLTFAAKRTAN